MNAQLLFLHALSPLSAGTGQGVGVIDLPIAREKATGLPYLPGSSLKGVLRSHCTGKHLDAVFGPSPDSAEAPEYAGSAQFGDQRLLLLPIRSLKGTFAWVTCPYLLRRLKRDARNAQVTSAPPSVPEPTDSGHCIIVQNNSKLLFKSRQSQRVILEDLDLHAKEEIEATKWANWIAERVFPTDQEWQTMLNARFCIIHDDTFSFLLETATEIIARIKLMDDTKTVQKGGLWYEEALPTETILSGLIVATPVKKTNLTVEQIFSEIKALTQQTMQFGGNATVGRGLCRLELA